ncbi:MAG TPA: YcxB family protein [Flavisolibacter sp.]|nr:YcxB family protein [Flavisolibacter sp.]
MTIQIAYEKNKVLQALRYHFLSRREIRLMIILVNVFALVSAILFYYKKILPLALLTGSFLWFVLMISFWFILPGMVYRRAATFKDHFQMTFENDFFTVGNERGSRSFNWTDLSNYLETPYFFHLYFDNRSFFLVPKEAFANSDEVCAFRQLLKEKVGTSRNQK